MPILPALVTERMTGDARADHSLVARAKRAHIDHPEEEAGYADLALVARARARLAGAGHPERMKRENGNLVVVAQARDPVESNIKRR